MLAGSEKNSLATSSWKSVRSGVPSVPLSPPLAVPGIYAAAARDAWIAPDLLTGSWSRRYLQNRRAPTPDHRAAEPVLGRRLFFLRVFRAVFTHGPAR